jgi:phage tail tube protein FII
VTYLALIFGGQKYWELDFFNNGAIVAGIDVNAKTRANL